MSEGMIIRRGGGASLKATDALLRVQAPAGSVVTITKGSVTKTDLGHENADNHTVYDYYFIIHQSQFDSVNSWTVTATLGAQSKTSTIIIDAADEYDMVLSYLLPAGYQLVEYLESTGTQYINSGLTFAHGDRCTLKGQMTAAQNDNTFFEVTSSSSVRSLIWGKADRTLNFFDNSTGSTRTSSAKALNTDINMIVDGAFKVDGTSYGSCQLTGQSRPAYIFAGNDIGSVARRGKVRIKYLKFTDSANNIKREFYPCYRISDSKAGLYDLKNNVFYTNNGSGTFLVGGDI